MNMKKSAQAPSRKKKFGNVKEGTGPKVRNITSDNQKNIVQINKPLTGDEQTDWNEEPR
jgi:hypothetical protein